MHKFTLAAFAALSVIPFTAAPSKAHVSLLQKEAAPGSYKAVFAVPHGCDGEPTTAFRVSLPEGFIGAKPMPKPGWTIEIEEGDYAETYRLHGEEVSSGPLSVTWSGGSLADSHYDEFTVRGTLAGVEEGERLYFKAVQTCSSGKEEAWDQEAPAGEDAHALDNPAPFVTIVAEHTAHHDHAAADEAGADTAGDVSVSSAWARAMLPGQSTGGGYMTIRNEGQEPDALLSVSSPVAGKVEIHSMEMKDDVMVMRPLEDGLEIPAGGSVTLEPGGLHLMFMQVETPFAEGAEVPVTLEFEKAGRVEVVLPVRSARAGRGQDAHQH